MSAELQQAEKIMGQIKVYMKFFDKLAVERRAAYSKVDNVRLMRLQEHGMTHESVHEIDARMEKGQQMMRALSAEIEKLGYAIHFFDYTLEKFDETKLHSVCGMYGIKTQLDRKFVKTTR